METGRKRVLTARRSCDLTGTFPKNAGSTFLFASKRARALCWNPRRRFHFSGPSGFPVVRRGCRGRFLDSGNLSRIERKPGKNWGSRVDYLGSKSSFLSSRPWRSLRNPRSWRVLATANRRDWFVRNSKCFCRVFHLSRNDRIAKGIVARNDF